MSTDEHGLRNEFCFSFLEISFYYGEHKIFDMSLRGTDEARFLADARNALSGHEAIRAASRAPKYSGRGDPDEIPRSARDDPSGRIASPAKAGSQ